jgi:hypothetical protein
LSPTHQIYSTGFNNFGYPNWHSGWLEQSTYHYQPGEYISVIGETK